MCCGLCLNLDVLCDPLHRPLNCMHVPFCELDSVPPPTILHSFLFSLCFLSVPSISLHSTHTHTHTWMMMNILWWTALSFLTQLDVTVCASYHHVDFMSAVDDGDCDGVRLMLDNHPDMATTTLDDDGNTALRRALESRNEVLSRILIDIAPNAARMRDVYDCLPLHVSLMLKMSKEIIGVLMSANPDAMTDNSCRGWYPLHLAIALDLGSGVLGVLNQPETAGELRNSAGHTPLLAAIHQGCPADVLQQLIAQFPHAACLNDGWGSYPIHVFLGKGGRPASVALMLLNECPVAASVHDGAGDFAIHLALKYSVPSEIVQSLLAIAPQTAREQDGEGNTALYISLLKKNVYRVTRFSIVQKLLWLHPSAAGIVDEWGCTPLHTAMENLADPSLVLALLRSHPESTTQRDHEGNLPLHWVLHHYSTSPHLVAEIIRPFPDAAGLKSGHNLTPLHISLHRHHNASIIHMLLELSPSATHERQPITGDTALHLSIRYGYPMRIVRALVDEYPEALKMRDRRGHLPSDDCNRGTHCAFIIS